MIVQVPGQGHDVRLLDLPPLHRGLDEADGDVVGLQIRRQLVLVVRIAGDLLADEEHEPRRDAEALQVLLVG